MTGDGEDKDVLIRIHTAVHNAEEAVDLAAFIKGIIPKARILGTSTSAISMRLQRPRIITYWRSTEKQQRTSSLKA